MTDYFALLGVKRGPKVDVDLLQANFHRLSHALHPDHLDKVEAERTDNSVGAFAEINAAYRCLRETKDRLAHLIEIELGRKPESIQHIPDEIASVGAQVMMICRGVDAFLGNRQKNPPPMVRAQQFKDSMEWLSKCDALDAALDPLRVQLEMELEKLDVAWDQPPEHASSIPGAEIAIDLDRCYRLASYVTKWTNQIKERQFVLTL